MNEIEKLKIDNARYRKALKDISDRYPATCDAYKMADCALNPTPVTLDMLKAVLKKFSAGTARGSYSITFFGDESGTVEDYGREAFSFQSFQQAYRLLNDRVLYD